MDKFTEENLRFRVWHITRFSILLILLSFAFIEAANAEYMSKAWRGLLEKRSTSIFTESIDLGGMRVGGRGKIMFVWLDRSLNKVLQKDGDVEDSITNGLAYYFNSKKEVASLVKNRDVFLLSYHAIKRWDFKIEEIVINGYRLTVDDILTSTYYRVLGELPPKRDLEKLVEGEEYLDDYQLHVAVPSMPKSGKVKISYGDDTVEWEIPKR
ncbi:MAG: hypothetical protein FWH52_07460 [Synergistaceae bacterium]|nr:hypothetical protein [Synergistaceae bacterium]